MASGTKQRLTKGLSLWQVVGVSVALMAPSMAANINPQGSVGTVGRAVPLTFVIALVGVLFIAYVFARLTQRFNHAGSVYGFVGATLGPRAGMIAGWSLMGTYIFYGLVTITASAIFLTALLQSLAIWSAPPTWAPFLVGAIELVAVWYLAVRPVRNGTRVLLGTELITVALILLLSTIVLVKLIVGHGPEGQHFTLSVFSLSKGVGVSALFLGVVFGFLSFAGFEASATLGEESSRPRRDIPRAIIGTAIFGGVFFVFVTAVEVMGMGTSAKELTTFGNTGSLLGTLGSTYIASWLGNVVTLGTVVSAFGCSLASTVSASRLAYSLSRDAYGEGGLGTVSERTGTPVRASTAVVGIILAVSWVSALVFHATAFDEFLWFGTIGTLIILFAYSMATAGAIRLLFFKERGTVPTWEIVLPIMAMVLLVYTLYRNVIPYPTGASFWFPVVSGGWILVAVAVVVFAPGLASRVGAELAHAEGLELVSGSDGEDGLADVRPSMETP
ncbi:MAG: APC family permease [Ferrimicrobium sp.]